MAEPKKIDRSKFKSSSVAAMTSEDKKVDQVVRNKKVKADFHKIKNGDNYHRIYPAHPDGGGTAYAEARVVHWLPAMVPVKDDKGNFKKGNDDKLVMQKGWKTVFNSKVHGNTPKDIVEEYISFVEKIAKDNYPEAKDENKRIEFLVPVHGKYAKNSKDSVQGIMAKSSWILYTDEITGDPSSPVFVFGQLEIGKAVKQRLNAIAANEASSDPLGTDPYTDLEEGRAINIKYNKEATKPADYYTTDLYAPIIKNSGGKVQLFPLTDDRLDKFITYPSLASMFRGAYKKRDFDLALKGLKMFDDEHEFGVFGYDDFLATVEEIQAYYPEDDDAEKTATTDNPEAEDDATGTTGDEFDQMDRGELKDFARDNNTGVIIKQNLKDDDIRQLLRDWRKAQEVLGSGAVTKEEVKEDKKGEKKEKEDKKLSAKDKIKAMQSKKK